MIDLFIGNIFLKFGECLFRQDVGIPMGTNCAPLLADLFLYSYEGDVSDSLIRSDHRRLTGPFNLCYSLLDHFQEQKVDRLS